MPGWTSFARFLLFFLIAWPAVAHDTLVVSPKAGDPTRLDIMPSPALGASWNDVHVARLLVRTANRQQRLAGRGEGHGEGRAEPVVWHPSGEECSILVADLAPAIEREQADAWRRLTHATKRLVCPEAPEAPKDLATWLAMRRRVGALATAKSGSRIEVRPLLNPASLRPGRDLPVRIYRDGVSQIGVEVRAEGPSGHTVSARTDASGIATLRISSPGWWRVRYRTTLDDRASQATFAFDVVSNETWDAALDAGGAQ